MNWIEHNINKICRQNAGTATWWFTNERSSQDEKKNIIGKLFYEMRMQIGLFQPKFGSNMNKPKCWVENVI